MRKLYYKESWVPKNWRFWTVVSEKTLESPLDCKEIQPVDSKDQSWVFIGRTDVEAETPILWPPDAKSWLFVTPWTTAHQASLSITNSRSLPKPMSIESVMPSNHLILCLPLLLLSSIFPSIRVFQVSQLFASGGQSIGVSASTSVLPMNTQNWFPLEWLVGSPCSARDFQESSPTPQFKSINS